MLVEPELDLKRQALDQAVITAVRARLAADGRASVDAEAIGLRQLLADVAAHERPMVRAMLGRIEAASASALPLTTCGPLAQMLASDRWGLQHSPVAEPDQALQAAATGRRALIDLAGRAWWARLLAMPSLKVIAALPDDAAAQPRALLISTESPGPTGDDRSFWVTDSGLPDSRITQSMSDLGFHASLMASGGGLKLFVLAGYVQAEDHRLLDAPGQLSGVIGAAPVY